MGHPQALGAHEIAAFALVVDAKDNRLRPSTATAVLLILAVLRDGRFCRCQRLLDAAVVHPMETLSPGRAIAMSLASAIAVQVLLLFSIGFAERNTGDAPSIAFAGGAYYCLSAVVIGMVACLLELGGTKRVNRLSIRLGMFFIAVCALNLLFVKFWMGYDAVVRATTHVVYMRSWGVGAVVIPLQFFLCVLNSTCLLLALFRSPRSKTIAPSRSRLG